MEHTGIRKVYDVVCNVEIDFKFNFLFDRLNKAAMDYSSTGVFTARIFKKRERIEGLGHRTYFGPYFDHSGVVYARTRHNTQMCISRLFHQKVDVASLHAIQPCVVAAPALVVYRQHLGHLVNSLIWSTPGDWSEKCAQEAFAPHVKRALRAPAWLEIMQDSADASEDVTFIPKGKYVQVNIKPDEFGKPGKPPRAVNDLGVKASLRAPWLVNAIKTLMAERPLYHNGWRYKFVKSPSMEALAEAFEGMMIHNSFIYFSDDSSVSFQTSEGPFWANLDITSCDASNGPSVFEALLDFAPGILRRHMQALLNQCKAPCRVGYGRGALKFKPMTYFEYSGSLLTTLLNNVANLALGFYITQGYTPRSKVETVSWIETKLKTCGWKCTLQVCSRFEEVQFLKCSPCRTIDGRWVPVLNLGVILRSFGQRRGDLPGRGELADRARRFNVGLVKGYVHAGNHQLLRTLQTKFLAEEGCDVQYNSNAVQHITDGIADLLDDSSVCARYGIPLSAYDELCDLVMMADVGDRISCHASRAILQLDYGL